MTDFCTPPIVPGMAAALLADTDCQGFGLVERGYAALSQPGGIVSTGLTGLLVIAVALFGYRLLLGRGLLLADAVGLTIKIGVVLLVASSWESWQTIAYDTLARTPTRIASDLLAGMGARDPIAGLQDALNSLESASVGYRTRAGIASPLVGGPAAAAMTLYVASTILTLSIMGLLVMARIVLALMLAIAPVMAGFILFDATRGMAARWLSVMAGAAFAPLFVLVLAAVELSVVAPLIARLLAQQAGNRFDNDAVTPIGLVILVFAIAMVVAVRAGARIASGIRLPGPRTSVPADAAIIRENNMFRAAIVEPQSAATRISQSLERTTRRESGANPTITGASSATQFRDGSSASSTRRGGALPSDPSGHSRHMIMPRARRSSRAAARRDG